MSSWFKNVIYAGYVAEPSAEVRKQILIASLFSLLSFILLTAYGIDGIIRGHWPLAAVVLIFAFVMGGNYCYLRRTGHFRSSSIIIVSLMCSLCIYLLCTGGSGNTGPLWFYVLPLLIYYVLGLYLGTVVLVGLLGFCLILLFYPGNPLMTTTYSMQFLERFFGSLLSVSIMSLVYEYTREDGRRELIALSQELDLLSRCDELTGLANRRDMIERLNNELSRFERNTKNFSILVADIDHFKRVNDSFGHECGDFVLKEVAALFVKNTQKRDCVSRWGGEEFLILLPETTGARAAKIAERLRLAIESHAMVYNDQPVQVTISLGVSEFQPDMSLNELINQADTLMYEAKVSGRNRVIHGLDAE